MAQTPPNTTTRSDISFSVLHPFPTSSQASSLLTKTVWTVFNTFFFIGSLPINLVYAGIFGTVELCFGLVAASYFAAADGYPERSVALQKAGGAFGFLSGLLGWYTMANLMCQTSCFYRFPMGDTSRFFIRGKKDA